MNQIKSKLVFLLAIFVQVFPDYLAREEVSDFIDYMNEKHDFDRDSKQPSWRSQSSRKSNKDNE